MDDYITSVEATDMLSMTRVVVSGTVASIVMGMTGASIGAAFFDTATIPFVLSSCAGFIFGAWGFYRDAVRKSQRALDRFPKLLQLHLDANFPHRGFDRWGRAQLRSDIFKKNWVMQSMLIASWMTANRAIEVCTKLSISATTTSNIQAYIRG
jgi:hypothetical protein